MTEAWMIPKTEKTCGNCEYAYYQRDDLHLIPGQAYLQHCGNENYNADSYTEEMMMEDRGGGHCRFWTPQKLEERICPNPYTS